MDPDQALLDARAAAQRIEDSDEPKASDVEDLVRSFLALDESLSDGGFLPAAWNCRPV